MAIGGETTSERTGEDRDGAEKSETEREVVCVTVGDDDVDDRHIRAPRRAGTPLDQLVTCGR